MLLLKTIILMLCLGSLTFAGDLIADINYGDSRDEVAKKLSTNKSVKSSIPASMLSRVGLNGSYTTTTDLKGLKFALYFDWTDGGGLKEVSYRSDALVAYNYDDRLKKIWNHAYHFISAIYGKAKNAGEYPKKSDVTKDSIYFSHEWRTNSGYIYLGMGQQNNKYSVNITFSKVSLEK